MENGERFTVNAKICRPNLNEPDSYILFVNLTFLVILFSTVNPSSIEELNLTLLKIKIMLSLNSNKNEFHFYPSFDFKDETIF